MNCHGQTRSSYQVLLKSVIYYDKAIVIVDKPPGLVCQLTRSKAAGEAEIHLNPLLEALRNRLGNELYPVHRLDKGTTGTLLFARSLAYAREISRHLQRRTLEKTYLALVRGGRKTFSATSGEIRTSLKYTNGRASVDLTAESEHPMTEWQLVDSSPTVPLSLLRLKLHTGHKHQLRIHLADCLNAPILGDTVYSTKRLSKAIQTISAVPGDRIFLHASQLSLFRYKSSGPKKRFSLGIRSPLPADFLKICNDCSIKVDPMEADGGIFVDGRLASNGEVSELNGKWMPRLDLDSLSI